jgi:hypothetical protein
MKKNQMPLIRLTETYKHYSGKTSETKYDKRHTHRHERHLAKRMLQNFSWAREA